MKFKDHDGSEFETTIPRQIQFITQMEDAGIPWRVYSGRLMFGKECPAAVTSDEFSEHDIVRATSLNGLRTDHMGKNTVVYTG